MIKKSSEKKLSKKAILVIEDERPLLEVINAKLEKKFTTNDLLSS